MGSAAGGPSRQLVWAVLLTSTITACAEKAPPAPRPTSISPNAAANDLDVRVVISGEGLSPRFVTDFNNHNASTVRDTFKAFLGESELRDVQVQSNGSLQATVPLGLTPGKYPLVVEDPIGATGELPDAFEVLDAALVPRAIAITSNPQTLRTGACSQPVTLELRGSTGAPIATPTDLTLTLAALPLRFFPDATCTGAELTTLTLPAGSTTGTFHFASVIAGTHPLTASAQGLTSGTQDEVIVTAANCLPTDPDGTPCDDGTLCTTGETCQSGVCSGGTAVVCTAQSPCHDIGTCSAATGLCSNPAKAEGASCEDGISCTSGETCRQGICGGAAQFTGCLNTPPIACLTITPTAAALGTQRIFNASCSRDLETPSSALEARFDFDGNGTFDNTFGAQQATFTPNTAGVFKAQVEVRDDGGITGFATKHLLAAAATDDVIVTTATDENDANASPLLPGGTGLSFREAVAYANQASNRIVRFNGAMSLSVANVARVTATNFAIVGEQNVTITFTQAQGGICLQLDGTGNKLIGVKLAGCPGVPVDVQGANSVIADNDIRADDPIRLDGTGIQFLNNDVHNITGTDAVRVTASNITLDGNRIHDNAGAAITIVQAAGTGHVIQRNVLFRNGGGGVKVENGIGAPVIRHNVFDSNGTHAVSLGTLSAPAIVVNNLFTRNQGFALSGTAASQFRPNLLFSNTGATSFGGDAGITADPLYISADGGDLRIRPESPAVNAAIDAGVDLNGPEPGLFNGSAPDLGAHETP